MMAQMLSRPAIRPAPGLRSPKLLFPLRDAKDRGGKGYRGKHRAGIPYRSGRRAAHAEAAVQIK